jgi:hypothetical protein
VKFHASDAPVGSKVYQNATIHHYHANNNTFGRFAIVLQQSTCYGVSELGNLLLLL